LFKEYDFEVILKPGQLNMGLDHLSRIETKVEPTNLEEGLHDAHIFVVDVMDGYFEDIIQFLTLETAPEGFSIQQKKELVVCTVDFFVIVGHLYKMGCDDIWKRYVPEH